MTWQRILTLLAAIGLGAGAWRAGGGAGLALLGSGLMLWFLLYYTRLVTIMRRAAERPVGYIGSAVMLNARLKPNMPLLNVVGLTRSLGERLTAEGVEPEVYRWRDPGESQVTAEFVGGRLVRWQLERPAPAPGDAPSTADDPT